MNKKVRSLMLGGLIAMSLSLPTEVNAIGGVCVARPISVARPVTIARPIATPKPTTILRPTATNTVPRVNSVKVTPKITMPKITTPKINKGNSKLGTTKTNHMVIPFISNTNHKKHHDDDEDEAIYQQDQQQGMRRMDFKTFMFSLLGAGILCIALIIIAVKYVFG